ncbi:MAG: (Fe-S)-binding protein [Candidatus Hadarchaeales archaeon]
MEGVEDKLFLCALCPNMCRFSCPVEEVAGTETSSPQGKALTSLLLLRGELPWTEENARPPYLCLDCQACKLFCPFDFDLPSLFHPVRVKAASKIHPPEVHSRLLRMREKGNPFGEPREKRVVGKGEVAYLPGCTAEMKEREVLLSTLRLLEGAGVGAVLLEGYCCGLPSFRAGDEKRAEELRGEVEGVLRSLGVGILLLSCPGCLEFLSGLEGIEVFHTSTFFLKLVEEGKMGLPRLSGRVTYHDPCSLGRKRGIFDPPRKLLKELGLEVVEPLKTRERAVCCGGGNPLEEARGVSRKRAKELAETAELTVTTCPTCKWALGREGLRVLDLSQVLEGRLG